MKFDFAEVAPAAFDYGRSKYTHGAVVRVDLSAPSAPTFYILNSDGTLRFNRRFEIPNAERIELMISDAAPDHLVWLCGDGYSADGKKFDFFAISMTQKKQST